MRARASVRTYFLQFLLQNIWRKFSCREPVSAEGADRKSCEQKDMSCIFRLWVCERHIAVDS